MKRCPTCNQTFKEEWLSFCTQDGTTLIEESISIDEPPPTIMATPPPSGEWKPPSGGSGYQPIPPPAVPSNLGQPSGGFGSGQFQPPQQMQPGWQPPPPAAYANKPKQGLAVASFVLGMASFPLVFLCYFGMLTSLVAIVLGIISLVQIKNKPEENGGKPFAIIGIVLGGLCLVTVPLFILIYAISITSLNQ